MKITDQNGVGGPNRPGQASGVRGEVKRGRETAPGTPAQDDKVSVSEEARTLSRLRAEVGDIGTVRTEKVEELRAKIDRGEFQIDLKAVARKLLESIFGELGK
jgi:negative regulator of flagellin synthesis FlgM